MPVKDVEELHAEVGVDPFGEHGDGLGDVKVLARVEEFAEVAEGFGRVAKGEAGRGRKRRRVESEACPIDEFTITADTVRIHPRNNVGTGVSVAGCALVPGKDARGPARRGYAEWGAALVLLDGGNLPSPSQYVDGPALIGKLLAFSEG